jgi:hypothetical protein
MYLDVPFVSQLDYGGSQHLDDPTGCWYSSACMIAYAYEAGPRRGVPELWSMETVMADGSVRTSHWAIPYEWLSTLMRNEHLVELHGGFPATAGALNMAVRFYGPLFMCWMKTHGGNTYGHASVIIGVDGDEVIYHDPENAPRSRMSYADTKAKLAQGWPVLRRDALPFTYNVSSHS